MSKKKMPPRVILLGRKRGAADALVWLLKNGVSVPLVVASSVERDDGSLSKTARAHHIPVLFDVRKLYTCIEKRDKRAANIDLVISYLFPDRIRQDLIDLGKRGCVNFHPAPLPDYKSRAGYNTAILDGRRDYGVSAHYIDSEKFDSGPIIKVLKFPIDAKTETAFTLEKQAQEKLLMLFKQVMPRLLTGARIRTIKNVGGLYLTATQLEALKRVTSADTAETIDRKIRAFFFPPHGGATIQIAGASYTIINDDILRLINSMLKERNKNEA